MYYHYKVYHHTVQIVIFYPNSFWPIIWIYELPQVCLHPPLLFYDSLVQGSNLLAVSFGGEWDDSLPPGLPDNNKQVNHYFYKNHRQWSGNLINLCNWLPPSHLGQFLWFHKSVAQAQNHYSSHSFILYLSFCCYFVAKIILQTTIYCPLCDNFTCNIYTVYFVITYMHT